MLPIGGQREGNLFGFTLIEIVVVLAIISLFISMLTLRIESFLTGGDMRLATRIVISEIRMMRGKAAHDRKDQILVIQMDNNTLYPLEMSSNQSAGDRIWANYGEEKDRNYRHLPEGVSVEDVVVLPYGKKQEGEAKIRFFANGTVERSLIHLRNEKGEIYTLEIKPFTGDVLIHDRYVDQKVL